MTVYVKFFLATLVPLVFGMQLHAQERGMLTLTIRDGKQGYNQGQHLYRQVDVPSFSDLRCNLIVHKWSALTQQVDTTDHDASASIRPLGKRAGAPVALVQINPTKVFRGTKYVADSMTVVVSWATPQEFPQPQVVVNNSWYEPSAPHVRLRTNRDGVACITASDVLSINPSFNNVGINELALIWRGTEQYIGIIDSDNSNTFTNTDTILFQGRRPSGDTTFFSTYDSVSVFFLTTRTDGDRLRMEQLVGPNPQQSQIDMLSIETHIELDTGYYHLGSALNSDYSDYNTHLAFLEGFYWDRLNSNTFQKSINRYTLTPAPGGKTSFTALYATTTDVISMNPDTRADFIVNGYESSFLESDGFNYRSITITTANENVVSGQQSLALYATGIDSLRGQLGYLSDLMLDAYEVRSDVLPVLDSGRISGFMKSAQGSAAISVSNASTPGYGIDTIQHGWFRLHETERSRVVRAGMSPRDRAWSSDALVQGSWRATGVIDDEIVDLDNIQSFVLVRLMNPGEQPLITMFNNADSLANLISQLRTKEACLLFNGGGQPTSNLQSAMSAKNLTMPSGKYWVLAGVANQSSSASSSDEVKPFGTTLRSYYTSAPFRDLSALLPAGEKRMLFLCDGKGLEHARIGQAQLNNIGSVTDQTDMFIITYKLHREQAERLAEHRRKTNGINVRVVDIDDVIDEYGYGNRNPEGLRQYLWHAYSVAAEPKPKYVILFGSASWDQRLAVKGGNVGARLPDQIPTYGKPSSDYFFSMLDDPKDYGVPEVIVGRIPAYTSIDGKAVVDKIVHYDTMSFQPWMRRWMFIGGGSESEGLCDPYKYMLNDPFETGIKFTNPPLCLDTITLCKYEAPPNAGFYIKQEINKGLHWLNYYGHGAIEIFDISGWEPSELFNDGRYGILATYSCQTGAFSNPSTPGKNGQYMTEPNKGFVAAVGGTGWGKIAASTQLQYRIHENLRDTSLSTMLRFLGDLYYASKIEFSYTGDQDGINALMQNNILGDPMLRVKIDTVVNVYMHNSDLTVTGKRGVSEITDADSVAFVNVGINNSGIGTEQPFAVSIKHTYAGIDSVAQQIVDGICVGSRIVFPITVLNKPGLHKIELTADAEYVLGDDRKDNTVATSFTVIPRALLPLIPVANGFVERNNISIRVLDPTYKPNTVHFAICNKKSLAPENVLLPSDESEVTRLSLGSSIVDWKSTAGAALPIGSAWLAAWLTFSDTLQTSSVMWIPVTIVDSPPEFTVKVDAENLINETPESVEYDSVDKVYRLKKKTQNIYIRSSGLPTPNVDTEPILEFRVNDITYLKNPFLRGINLMLINEVDTIPHTFRWYDTYFDPYPPEVGYNGTTSDLIRFLRDSVPADDRVAFASCRESFTGFKKDGNLDTLIDLLHLYGSRFADSLDSASSWAMIGQRGMSPGSAMELWKGAPDSLVTLNTRIVFYAKSGSLSMEYIGSGRHWDSVWCEQSLNGSRWSLIGRMRNGSEIILKDFSDSGTVWNGDTLADIPLQVKLQWQLQHIGGDSISARVRSARAAFKNAYEWIIEPESVSLEPTEALRGDTVTLHVGLSNAFSSEGTPSASLLISIDKSDNGSNSYRDRKGVALINDPWSESDVDIRFPTEGLSNVSDVSVEFDSEREQYQFYRFNDKRTMVLNVREDDIPPTVTVRADSQDVTNGAYVLREPYLEILINDNSQLQITDSNKLTVFVNGDRIKDANTTEYNWLPTKECDTVYRAGNIKAALQFRYPLELGQNNLVVWASDATGNEVQWDTQLWTTDGDEIASVITSPTPSTGPVDFIVALKTNRIGTYGIIQVFDVKGRLVKTLTHKLRVGTAAIAWDGYGDDGQSIPSGIYVYHLNVFSTANQPLANITGNLMILR